MSRDKVFVNTYLHLILCNDLTVGHLEATTRNEVCCHVYLLSAMKFALLVPVASIRTSEVLSDNVRSALRIFAVLIFANEVSQ